MDPVTGINRNFRRKWALILNERIVCDLDEDSCIGKVTDSPGT